MQRDTLALVHEFTRTHKTTIENDDGTRTYVDIYSHLEQLQQAISGTGTGGGGSNGKARAPISLKAVDLWKNIAETTLQHWPGYGRNHLANTPLPQRVQQWAAVAVNSNNPTDEETLHNYLRHWISEIRSLSEPSIDLASPCPECHESYIWRHDGVHNVKKRCLRYNTEMAWCASCGQTWDGKASMVNLARIINTTPATSEPAHTSESS